MTRDPWNSDQPRMYFGRSAAEQVARGGDLQGLEVSPWVIARLRELTGIGPGDHPPRFTISAVRAMSTQTMLVILRSSGVQVDVGRFAELAAPYASAWEMSEEAWRPLPSADPEFLGLAACELWRRLLPGRPSLEMLDERMQEGYDLLEESEQERACEVWIWLGYDLCRALSPDADTLEEACADFDALNILRNWLGDLRQELYNTGRQYPELGQRAAALFEHLYWQFDPSEERYSLRCAQADLLYAQGLAQQGDEILQELIEDWPQKWEATARLSDQLSGAGNSPEYLDIDRAIALLESTLAGPVEEREHLQARLLDLKARKS